MTRDQWSEIRAEWEASPRRGLAWLTQSEGGRWPITEESLRRRRSADGWTKRGGMAEVVRRARVGADRVSAQTSKAEAAAEAEAAPKLGFGAAEVGSAATKTCAREGTASAGPAVSPDVASEQAAVDLRTRLIQMHRDEWKAVRALAYRAMEEGKAATGFEKAKFAKIASETLKNVQDGERRAWSLDVDMIDFDALSDAQLEAIAKGKMPR